MIEGFKGTAGEKRMARELGKTMRGIDAEQLSITVAAIMVILGVKGLVFPQEIQEIASMIADA